MRNYFEFLLVNWDVNGLSPFETFACADESQIAYFDTLLKNVGGPYAGIAVRSVTKCYVKLDKEFMLDILNFPNYFGKPGQFYQGTQCRNLVGYAWYRLVQMQPSPVGELYNETLSDIFTFKSPRKKEIAKRHRR